MSDYYTIGQCPKCQSDCWQKLGGYRNTPVDYSCLICGIVLSRVKATVQSQEATNESPQA